MHLSHHGYLDTIPSSLVFARLVPSRLSSYRVARFTSAHVSGEVAVLSRWRQPRFGTILRDYKKKNKSPTEDVVWQVSHVLHFRA